MPSNKGMHQTKRWSRQMLYDGPSIINVRFAGDACCYAT
jgi:hypothetical protein